MKANESKVYPSRVNGKILKQANRLRKTHGVSWPFLTEKLLRLYLKKGTAILG